MKLALLTPALAIAALGIAACGEDSEMARDDMRTREELAARETTPDYRYNPPATAPDMDTIAPPADPSPRPLDPADPTQPPPGTPPPPVPYSPGSP